jgi:uncharacterized membrane protein (UPF0127 family)
VIPRRLRRLDSVLLASGLTVHLARSARARLLGLAFMRDFPRDRALLLEGCRSVHTFGMRFAIDVVFLDAVGRPLRVVRGMRPCRVVSCRGAAAVLERRAARDGMIPAMADQAFANRFRQALDPRVPIYRDAYNEYFMLVLSAGGAAAGTQVPLYIVMAITGLWGVVPFALACVAFELAVIFGLARPRMKPNERLGWAALWSFATAVLAVCFYYLVAEPTL